MTIRWEEGYSAISELMKTLATKITNNKTDTNWILHFPQNLADITKTFTLKYELKDGATVKNTVYVEFHKPDTISVKDRITDTIKNNIDNYHCLEIVFGTNYTSPANSDTKGTWEVDTDSTRMRYAWFMGDTTASLKGWTPVQFWISITDTNIAIVMEGNPSASLTDRLISFAYLGQLKSFNVDTAISDITNNFGVTVSSDMLPYEYLTSDEYTKYNKGTGTGVLDVCMLKTYSGFPMQAHSVAFATPDEFGRKAINGPSQWTKKYHMSPVYVLHEFDGYRGELNGVVACDKSTIVNLDELIHKYNTLGTGTPNKQDTYKAFLVNAPYSIMNNSSNVTYCIAILKDSQDI